MTPEQIALVRSIDKTGVEGSIQAFLLLPGIEEAPFESVLLKMVGQLYLDKQALIRDNIKLSQQIYGRGT